jgi:CDP-6-deoxy-D-xylo-4-hexulose-3-dehydrase
MFYELAASSWDDKELEAIQRVIESDRFTMGPEVTAFEEEFAAYHDKKYGVMVNSGSSANLIAVAAQFFKKDNPLKRGDEVIVPAVSWSTMYHPLQQYGLKLRIVDIDLETLNMDVSQLEDALTPNTRMITTVSILGNPCDLDVMRAFCDKHDLILMEDNCESLDAELNGKKAGTFGDVNTFSFFFSHHIAI